MQMLEGKVLAKRVGDKEVGGIIVPGFGKISIVEATIVEAPPARYNPYKDIHIEPKVKVGDRVMYNLSSVAEIRVKSKGDKIGTKLDLVPEVEIIAILGENEEVQ